MLAAGLQISRVSNSLQALAEITLGPLLILVGLVLLDVIHPTVSIGGAWMERWSKRVADLSNVGAFLLGGPGSASPVRTTEPVFSFSVDLFGYFEISDKLKAWTSSRRSCWNGVRFARRCTRRARFGCCMNRKSRGCIIAPAARAGMR